MLLVLSGLLPPPGLAGEALQARACFCSVSVLWGFRARLALWRLGRAPLSGKPWKVGRQAQQFLICFLRTEGRRTNRKMDVTNFPSGSLKNNSMQPGTEMGPTSGDFKVNNPKDFEGKSHSDSKRGPLSSTPSWFLPHIR